MKAIFQNEYTCILMYNYQVKAFYKNEVGFSYPLEIHNGNTLCLISILEKFEAAMANYMKEEPILVNFEPKFPKLIKDNQI